MAGECRFLLENHNVDGYDISWKLKEKYQNQNCKIQNWVHISSSYLKNPFFNAPIYWFTFISTDNLAIYGHILLQNLVLLFWYSGTSSISNTADQPCHTGSYWAVYRHEIHPVWFICWMVILYSISFYLKL